ncbi:ABC-2 type transport system permease protein [Microbacterium sp. AG790]|nr:ABC-2 type transport system permease protein [Microbacterium sp. AG790]
MSSTMPRISTSLNARLSARGVLRSEWVKLRSVRSTAWCYGVLIALMVAIGLLVSSLSFSNSGSESTTGDLARSIVVDVNTAGLKITVLIACVLGALIVTGEYSTGMIRSTFAAVPRRTGALIAKAVVLAVTTFVATAIGIWLSAFVSWPSLASQQIDVDLGSPSVFMPLIGGAVYTTMVALLAFGFGVILRSTAGTLAVVLGLILVAPVIIPMLGGMVDADWARTLSALMPQNAGGQLFAFSGDASIPQSDTEALKLDGWGGFGVLAAWDVIVLAAAIALAKWRDA